MADYDVDDDKRPDATGGGGIPGPTTEPHDGDHADGEEGAPSPARRGRDRIEGHLHALRRRLRKAETEAQEARAIAERYVRQAETSDVERRLGGVEADLNARFQAATAKLRKAGSEDFDAEQIAAAQQELADVAVERSRLRVYRDSLKADGKQPDDSGPQRRPPAAAPVNEHAREWFEDNEDWFAMPPPADQEDLRKPFQRKMTTAAIKIDRELRDEGIDPNSKRFFDEVTKRMRQRFPDHFDEDDDRPAATDEPESQARPAARSMASAAPHLAGARSSAAPRPGGKVRLTAAQLQSAKRMHLTPEQFAKHLQA